jgi:hypothetical protein
VRILATQEAEIRKIKFQSSQPREIIPKILSPKEKKKTYHTKGLVEWLKMLPLSSNPSTKQTKTPEYKKKRAVGFGSRDTAICARRSQLSLTLGPGWEVGHVALYGPGMECSFCFPDLPTGLRGLTDSDPRWGSSLSPTTSIIRT